MLWRLIGCKRLGNDETANLKYNQLDGFPNKPGAEARRGLAHRGLLAETAAFVPAMFHASVVCPKMSIFPQTRLAIEVHYAVMGPRP